MRAVILFGLAQLTGCSERDTDTGLGIMLLAIDGLAFIVTGSVGLIYRTESDAEMKPGISGIRYVE